MTSEAFTFLDLAVIGISHQSAPLPLREAFAIVCHRLFKNRPTKDRSLGSQPKESSSIKALAIRCAAINDSPLDFHINEHALDESQVINRPTASVLVATCNRCELYLPGQSHLLNHVLQLLEASDLPSNWKEHLYVFKHDRAFRHLCEVTSGLQSAFFGETQIQGQVKVAYKHACEQPLTSHLHFTFQRALQISKRVRQEAIHGCQLSLEKLVWDLAEKKTPTFFIGASATNQLLIEYFIQKGARDLVLVNRSDSARSRALAKHRHLSILPWSEIDQWANYRNVVVATTSPYYLETFNKRQGPCATRHLFDLSVPCNINPSVQTLGIMLRSIDDLKSHLQTHEETQIVQYKQAIELIEELTKRHFLSLQARQKEQCFISRGFETRELSAI